MLIFDIETGPRPDIESLIPPFEPPAHPGEFDESSVKVGHLKDPKKIAEKIEAARAAHAKRVAEFSEEVEQAAVAYKASFVEQAPLCAAYGRVVAIGLLNPETDKFAVIAHDSEIEMLDRWWTKVSQCLKANRMLVGLNSHEFDLPFLVRRSWSLGIAFPKNVVSGMLDKWPKWHPAFVDLRKVWLLGAHPGGTKSSFETLAAAFGTPGKLGQSGKLFWQLWQQDRDAAIEYLERDVRQPAVWVKRMLWSSKAQ